MYHEPDNNDRANWAQAAVDAFQAGCRTDNEYAIQDLLADLLHLARRNGKDPQELIGNALSVFAEEEQEAREIAAEQ